MGDWVRRERREGWRVWHTYPRYFSSPDHFPHDFVGLFLGPLLCGHLDVGWGPERGTRS